MTALGVPGYCSPHPPKGATFEPANRRLNILQYAYTPSYVVRGQMPTALYAVAAANVDK